MLFINKLLEKNCNWTFFFFLKTHHSFHGLLRSDGLIIYLVIYHLATTGTHTWPNIVIHVQTVSDT